MMQAEKDAVLSLRQQQYSFTAIAEKTGLPLGTIKSFLSRVGEKKESPFPASAPLVTHNHTCCRQCDAPLDQTQRGKTRTFCSDRCRAAYWNEHRNLSRRASAHRHGRADQHKKSYTCIFPFQYPSHRNYLPACSHIRRLLQI